MRAVRALDLLLLFQKRHDLALDPRERMSLSQEHASATATCRHLRILREIDPSPDLVLIYIDV